MFRLLLVDDNWPLVVEIITEFDDILYLKKIVNGYNQSNYTIMADIHLKNKENIVDNTQIYRYKNIFQE